MHSLTYNLFGEVHTTDKLHSCSACSIINANWKCLPEMSICNANSTIAFAWSIGMPFEPLIWNGICFRMLQKASECFRMSESLSECLRMLQNASECFGMSQNASECFRMHQNVLGDASECLRGLDPSECFRIDILIFPWLGSRSRWHNSIKYFKCEKPP